jgi:hypothetical protein
MANKYWYKSGADANWATVTGNWWDDAAHTQQSAAVPATNDCIYLLGATSPATGPAAITFSGFDTQGLTAASLADAITQNITIAAGGTIVMALLGAASKAHYWKGNGSGANVTGTFNSTSRCNGTCTTATFNDSSRNLGTCTTATFNDSSTNGSTCTTATFNDSSYTSGGTIGTAIFNDKTYSSGVGGIITNGTYNDASYNIAPSDVTTGIFNNNSSLRGGGCTNATFNHGSSNLSFVTNGTFYDFAKNYGTVVSLVSHPCDWPAAVDVRSTAAPFYLGNENRQGTCVVPAAANVLSGVAVDAGVGTLLRGDR